MDYRKIKMKWGEHKVVVPITIDLCQDITNEICSPFLLHTKIFANNTVDYAIIAKLISFILEQDGVEVDPMEIWDSLNSLENCKGVIESVNSIINAICPEWVAEVDEDLGKKKATTK